MLRRLAEKGLIEHTPYGGANLTDEGWRRYLRLTRRHRLWEVFINRYLGIGWEDVYQYACSLEHATADLVEDKLAEFLENPESCPHGSPIPGKDLKRPVSHGIPMADLEVGRSAKVCNVIIEQDSELLHFLSSLNLTPGNEFRLVSKTPYDGTITIEADGKSSAIGRDVSSLVIVEPL